MMAGRLRKRVQLQTATEVDDSMGQLIPTAVTVATLWAGIEPLQGKEAEQAKQIVAEASHKITLRYRSGVTAKHWLLYGVRKFHIAAVLNRDERNHELTLLCTEGV